MAHRDENSPTRQHARSRRAIKPLFLVACWAASTAGAGTGWYATEKVVCDGADSLALPLQAARILAPDIDLVATSIPSGLVHVRLSVAKLREVTAANGALPVASSVLDSRTAPQFRDLLLGQERAVPWIITAAFDLIAGYIIRAEAALVMDGILAWAEKAQARPTISSKEAAFMVAREGKAETVLAVYQAPDKRRRAVYTTVYSVQVGAEMRTVLLYSCRYAVETTVAQFQTVSPTNNKIVRQDGAEWRVFDVDSNKYDKSILVYQDQDEEYFYFVVKAEPDRWRISFKGGAWQLFYNGKWKTMYGRVDAH